MSQTIARRALLARLEGSGFGFRTVRAFTADEVAQPYSCRMAWPG